MQLLKYLLFTEWSTVSMNEIMGSSIKLAKALLIPAIQAQPMSDWIAWKTQSKLWVTGSHGKQWDLQNIKKTIENSGQWIATGWDYCYEKQALTRKPSFKWNVLFEE